MRLDEICERMPRACINGLDLPARCRYGKDLLIGRDNIHTIPKLSVWMMPTAIPAIGIYLFPSIRKQLSRPSEWAARRIPREIIFKDTQGHSYYLKSPSHGQTPVWIW